ncbi:DUF3810 family protein [Neolewinella antarctica]|uniref:DUF3810 domain-containing protein n=1 Tax=Neolewinella antarctica TaxID=442734 RepID=A0ABX0XC55_9BACT|nr:DUF3810 family protein [Neolewinella antarctica]NJC26418.1 hypothetical protein [Neolewinella antarctica]
MTLRRLWPSALLSILLVLRFILPASAIEAVYSRGVFPVFRTVWDHTFPLLPIPLFFVFWLVVILLFARSLVQWNRARKQSSAGGAWKSLPGKIWNGAALLISVFLLGWGFNYGRVPVDEQLGFNRYNPTQDELRDRVYTEAEELAILRKKVTLDTQALSSLLLPPNLEPRVRAQVAQAFTDHGYPAPGRPRARQLQPKGILLRWSTAGVYWPWAGEANIDAGLHHLQKPAVMAHEFAHAYGFGDEGTCTFWAWLAGRETNDPYLNYAFKLAYWRQIAGRLRRAEPVEYTEWRAANLDPGIRNDLQAIYDNSAKYQDIAPAVRDLTYDAYLRAQGVHGGLANYGTVIQLVEGYRHAKK